MVDFHSHILPGIDDGSRSIEMSLTMLRRSSEQGVRTIFATPHFYADETSPKRFLSARSESFARLNDALQKNPSAYPKIRLGAEVLFFPGMSDAEELSRLMMENTDGLLVEPPMARWTDSMLNEIEAAGYNLHCIPVVAHVDRYMRCLRDGTLIDRVLDRRLLVQVNASFFIHEDTRDYALRLLSDGRIQFIGSDCHNNEDRAPNIGRAVRIIEDAGCKEALETLKRHVSRFIGLDSPV